MKMKTQYFILILIIIFGLAISVFGYGYLEAVRKVFIE